MHDAGEGHEILSTGSDHGHTDPLVAELLPDRRLGLLGQQTPQCAGVADGDLVVFDEEIDRLVGLALHDEHVVARLLELGAPVFAGLAEGDPAAQR